VRLPSEPTPSPDLAAEVFDEIVIARTMTASACTPPHAGLLLEARRRRAPVSTTPLKP
jgi:hypothetical protein